MDQRSTAKTTTDRAESDDQPIRRRTHAELLLRRRITITVIVCLIVIIGIALAKIFEPADISVPINQPQKPLPTQPSP